jgi:hypothetical protein
MSLISLVLISLTTARITRFVTTDVLFESPRSWVIQRLLPDEESSRLHALRSGLAYLIVCDWCASVYTGAAVAGSWALWGETMWHPVVCAAFSASYASGFLSTKGGPE